MLDEVPVEVRFPAGPPDRIALAERDPVFIRSTGRLTPATAADIGRSAADFVFLRDSLNAVPLVLKVARHAERLVEQNFTLAIGYKPHRGSNRYHGARDAAPRRYRCWLLEMR